MKILARIWDLIIYSADYIFCYFLAGIFAIFIKFAEIFGDVVEWFGEDNDENPRD
jgi:hypothetical protein